MKVAEVPDAEVVIIPGTGVVPGPVNVNVVAFNVVGFMASLKNTASFWFSGTAVAPLAGTTDVTKGTVPVVNVQGLGTGPATKGFPAGSFTPLPIAAVYTVVGRRLAAGVKVAVVPAKVTVPVIAAPPAGVTVKFTVLIDVGFIGTLNVALMVVLSGTAVAPFAGLVDVITGAVNPVC
jgi:hypothetical protein